MSLIARKINQDTSFQVPESNVSTSHLVLCLSKCNKHCFQMKGLQELMKWWPFQCEVNDPFVAEMGVNMTPGEGEESTVVTASSLSKVTTLFKKSNCALNSRKNPSQQSQKIGDSMHP